MKTKIGLDDFLENNSIEDFYKLPEEEVDSQISDSGMYYITDDNATGRWKQTKDGRVHAPLANFSARIIEEVQEDDGAEVKHVYKIIGASGNRRFPAIDVPAAQFEKMNWIHSFGSGAILEPGPSNKDYLRHQIQTMSKDKIVKTVCFAHTGWRNDGADWFYLSASGAIGKECINVRLSRENARYELPLYPENEQEAIKASLSFLNIGKKEITIPLFAITYLSPLTTLLNPQPNFVSYIYGQTGTFKTTLSLLQLSHFGKFNSIANLNNFDDTANSVERKGFVLKDVLTVLDDFHPSSQKKDAQSKESLAQRLIRSYSNRTARGRLNSDASDKGRYEPRGFLQITGEELPTLPSTQARTFIVEIEPGDIDRDKLTAIQNQADLLPHAMCSYILWTKEHMADIQAEFPARFRELRTMATREGQHKKLPEQTAFLLFTLNLVCQWLMNKNIFTQAQSESFLEEAQTIFDSISEKQSKRLAEEDPTRRFLEIIDAMLMNGSARLDAMKTGQFSIGGGNLIGHYDEDFVYLHPTSLWHELLSYCRREGSHYPFRKNTTYKLLKTAKILIPGNHDENTVLVRINNQIHRCVKIHRAYIKNGVTSVTDS